LDKAASEVPTLFGTTENAVYGQLYSALIVYVLLKFFYDTGSSMVPRHATIAYAQFSRLLLHNQLPESWLVKLILIWHNQLNLNNNKKIQYNP